MPLLPLSQGPCFENLWTRVMGTWSGFRDGGVSSYCGAEKSGQERSFLDKCLPVGVKNYEQT